MSVFHVKWFWMCDVSEKCLDFIESHFPEMGIGGGWAFDVEDAERYRRQAKADGEILEMIEKLEGVARKDGGCIEINIG